jgi:hypothetical protein
MAYDYNGFTTALAQEIAITPTNVDFVAMLPTFIQNAELRIYRDLDLLTTVFRDTAATLVFGRRAVTLPQTYGRFIVIDGVNLYVNGARSRALTPVSREFIDALYPSELAGGSALPAVFSRTDDATILVAPTAGASSGATGIEVVGTVRPAPLSATNTTNFIASYLPDLLLAAAMVEASGWTKSYGAQSDDPKMATSWDAIYQNRVLAAASEENRKKFQSGSWAPKNTVNV